MTLAPVIGDKGFMVWFQSERQHASTTTSSLAKSRPGSDRFTIPVSRACTSSNCALSARVWSWQREYLARLFVFTIREHTPYDGWKDHCSASLRFNWIDHCCLYLLKLFNANGRPAVWDGVPTFNFLFGEPIEFRGLEYPYNLNNKDNCYLSIRL